MTKHPEFTNNIPLIPLPEFQEKLKQILHVSKEESDRQLADFQASNVKQRTQAGQQKRGRKPKRKADSDTY